VETLSWYQTRSCKRLYRTIIRYYHPVIWNEESELNTMWIRQQATLRMADGETNVDVCPLPPLYVNQTTNNHVLNTCHLPYCWAYWTSNHCFEHLRSWNSSGCQRPLQVHFTRLKNHMEPRLWSPSYQHMPSVETWSLALGSYLYWFRYRCSQSHSLL
jgi:hypothetical protein